MSTREERIARLMDREVRKLELRAVVRGTRILSRFETRVIDAFKRSGAISLKAANRELARLISETMYVMFLTGEHRGRTLFRSREDVRLGEFDAAIRVLEKQRGNITGLNAVQRQYDTLALRVSNEVTKATEKRLRTTVNNLVKRGATPAEAVRGLRRRFRDLGLAHGGNADLNTLFQTQSQIAFQAGRWHEDQQNDDLWGYTYMTMGDDAVRPSHEDQHKVTLPKEHPFWDSWWPPNGYG